MACAARRQHGDAADSVAYRQLANGQALRCGDPRLRNDVQGLSPRGHPQYSTVWGDAPLHPRSGELVWREHLRDSDLQSGTRSRAKSLWHLAHIPGVLRSADDPVSAQVHDASAALLRKYRRARHGFRRRHRDVAADLQADLRPCRCGGTCSLVHHRRCTDPGGHSTHRGWLARRTPGTPLLYADTAYALYGGPRGADEVFRRKPAALSLSIGTGTVCLCAPEEAVCGRERHTSVAYHVQKAIFSSFEGLAEKCLIKTLWPLEP